jgi:hypothetical protein
VRPRDAGYGSPSTLRKSALQPAWCPYVREQADPSFPSRFGRAEGRHFILSSSLLPPLPSIESSALCGTSAHPACAAPEASQHGSRTSRTQALRLGVPRGTFPSLWRHSSRRQRPHQSPPAPLATAASPQREPGRFSAFLPCPDLGSMRREENQMLRPIPAMQCQAFHVERSETAPITSTGVPRGTFRAPTTRGLAHQLRFRTAFRPPTEGEQCLRELSGAGLPGRTGLSKAAFAMQKRLPNRCQ